MAARNATNAQPVALICGDDDFGVRLRARALYEQWCQELGGMDHEVIDAGAANVDEVSKAVRRLHEALQTLPFFGGGKAIWFKDCNFLGGEDRLSSSATVTEAVNGIATTLQSFAWGNVRLVVSAGKVDKRRSFFKTLDKIGTVEAFADLSLDEKDWAERAAGHVESEVRARQKEIHPSAVAALVQNVGPHLRQLTTEVEKVTLYIGDRPRVETADIEAITSKNKLARAFALGDALGDRNLPKLMRTLDEEMWTMQFDKKKSEVGMLYGLISKVRAMLFMKELMREGLVKLEREFFRFKPQLDRIPADRFGGDRKSSPLGMNPYVLFRAAQQSENYSLAELVRAMELLLECNLKMFSSGTSDEKLLLQQTMAQIVGLPAKAA